MATFSQTNVKCKDIVTFLTELKKYLSIGIELWFDSEKKWFYGAKHEENDSVEKNITIILAKNESEDWIEVEFDFKGNIYFYDEILRRISKTLDTEILLSYRQSTSGDGRLAKFKNGNLELSFFEISFEDKIYVADNFGVINSNIEALKNIKLGKESHIINYELIYKFFRSEGWKQDLVKKDIDYMYLHVEQKIE